MLHGSAPSSLPAGAHDELIALVLEKQARFVIDTTGDDLQRFAGKANIS